MAFDFKKFEVNLDNVLENFEKKKADRLVNEFIVAAVTDVGDITLKNAETVMQKLRGKKKFDLMEKTGEALIKLNLVSARIKRQLGQVYIENRKYEKAGSILKTVQNETAGGKNDSEYKEATGLLGRLFKQLYVNTNDPSLPQSKEYIKKSFEYYYSIYELDKQNNLWHGINTAAMLMRAERDGIVLTSTFSATKIATDILEVLEKDPASLPAWDLATGIEASLLLNQTDNINIWLDRYLKASGADAFEYASTLRQMKEVWQLNLDTEQGKKILSLLSAELLKKEGGKLSITPGEIKKQQKATGGKSKKLEKLFGADTYVSQQWLEKGLERCKAIARIGRETTKGFGTGFLMDGKQIHKKLAGRPVLFTNAHVVSDDPKKNNDSLTVAEVVITFESLSKEKEFSVNKIFKSSTPNKLDYSVLLFTKESETRLKKLIKNIDPYPVANALPLKDGKQRVYIIGHPAGGSLQISMQDNTLINHNDIKLHYRTPTVGGSSGSPVFNASWELIGIHHAGDEEMQSLDGSGRIYEANEGISILKILKEIQKK
jgi:V8-like Glu-specific endopeptidase